MEKKEPHPVRFPKKFNWRPQRLNINLTMKSILAKQDDGTIQLTITIPLEKVNKTREEIVSETAKVVKMPGFRKGKAPQKLVEENISEERIREEVLKKLLPESYIEAVKEHNLKPIMNPQIRLQKLSDPLTNSEQVDWEFTALTCEMPDTKLGNYKEEIQKITAKSKIIIPGKRKEPPKLDEIIKVLLGNTEVKIPGILLNQEVDKLLSQTLDEIKKLGLTLDQYLASTKQTPESLRANYQQKAETDLKLEFALAKITEAENITVDEKEIDEAIQKSKDENERKNLESNRYLLAGILRQQKTLDFLRNL